MVVVLKSFGTMRGDVTQVPEGIKVTAENGSITVLRFDQVACLAESLDAAYQQLSENVSFRDPNSFSPLFDWCLRNGLTQRAAEILAQTHSAKLDPSIRQSMQRRLDTRIQTVATENNQAWPSEFEQIPTSTTITAEQIDGVVEALPRGTEAFFNQQLHSKMVIGCSAAQCHSAETAQLPLRHHGKGMITPRGLTRHNLYQFLQYVDRNAPAESRILEMARTAHGSQKEPAFVLDDVGYLMLQQWVYAVSDHPEKYLTEVIQQQQPTQAPSVQDNSPPENVISQVGFVDDSAIPEVPAQSTQKPEPAAAISQLCDPDVFNRRHHPTRPK